MGKWLDTQACPDAFPESQILAKSCKMLHTFLKKGHGQRTTPGHGPQTRLVSGGWFLSFKELL